MGNKHAHPESEIRGSKDTNANNSGQETRPKEGNSERTSKFSKYKQNPKECFPDLKIEETKENEFIVNEQSKAEVKHSLDFVTDCVRVLSSAKIEAILCSPLVITDFVNVNKTPPSPTFGSAETKDVSLELLITLLSVQRLGLLEWESEAVGKNVNRINFSRGLTEEMVKAQVLHMEGGSSVTTNAEGSDSKDSYLIEVKLPLFPVNKLKPDERIEVKQPLVPINKLKPEDEILFEIDRSMRLPSYAYKVLPDKKDEDPKSSALRSIISNNTESRAKVKKVNPLQVKNMSIINNNLQAQFERGQQNNTGNNDTVALYKFTE